IKPAIAVDSNNTPHVFWLIEDLNGGTFYATNASGAWETTTVSEGYFYGPVDIAVGADDVPVIAYHDHQGRQFDPNLGDAVVGSLEGGEWTLTTIQDSGHDGWDTDVAVNADGWHVGGVDPSQFGGRDSIEYATNAFGDIRVEQVGSGPNEYEFGVSIETAPNGIVGLTYFQCPRSCESVNADSDDRNLVYAERSAGPDGSWTLTQVDTEGDVGRFSSLAYDADGNPHISYYVADSPSSGTVRYAWRDADGTWQFEDVGTVDNLMIGFTGARKITSLVLDADGVPHIAYTDRDTVTYASRTGDGEWTTQDIMTADEANLGQLVELALDSNGTPHLTTFDVTNPRPLNGNIYYGTIVG
ncbi:MAG: hypothetical protein D6737_15975, partial [Chloroflexi bacterium]